MNIKKTILAALTAMAMAVTAAAPIAVYADETTTETLYVNSGSTSTETPDGTSEKPYTTIQAAADAAATSEADEVVIEVVWEDTYEEYAPFWILSDNVTVEAADSDKKPVIKTLYSDDYDDVKYSGTLSETEVDKFTNRVYDGDSTTTNSFRTNLSGGIDIQATNATLKNLEIKSYGVQYTGVYSTNYSVTTYDRWWAAPICTYNGNWGYAQTLTITNCDIEFADDAKDTYNSWALFTGCPNLTVTGTTISGFNRAIYLNSVGSSVDPDESGEYNMSVVISDCDITGCGDEAINIQVQNGYTNGITTFITMYSITITDTTIDNGVIQIYDTYSASIPMTITLDGNELENGEIALLNLDYDKVDLTNANDEYVLAYLNLASTALAYGSETFLLTGWSFNTDGTLTGADYVISSSGSDSATYVGSDSSVITLTDDGSGTVTAELTSDGGYAVNLELSLEPVTDESGEEIDGEYYIVHSGLTADGNTAYINRFMSAQLKFKFDDAYTDESGETVTCDITKIGALSIEPNADIDMTMLDMGDGEYEFNVDGEKTDCVTATSVILGTATITGVGTYSLNVDTTYDTNQAHAAESANNIVSDFYYDADATGATSETSKLYLDSTIPATGVLGIDETDLTINVMFPNTVNDNAYTYESMTIGIDSLVLDDMTVYLGSNYGYATYADGTQDDTIKVNYIEANGSDYAYYTVTVPAALNYAVTLTFKGDGYRTYRVSVVPTSTTSTVTVWNNVMDGSTTVISADDADSSVAEQVTFLAGDIVNQGTIDLYDLSAVVSYFGKSNLDTTTASTYAQYDLNRDGKIDSKDIAMVLVSWGK